MSKRPEFETDNGCIVEISDDCLLIGDGGFVLTVAKASYGGTIGTSRDCHKVTVSNRKGHVGTFYFADRTTAVEFKEAVNMSVKEYKEKF